MIRGIAMDMDGLTTDTETMWVDCMIRACKRQGKGPDRDEIIACLGSSDESIVEDMKIKYGRDFDFMLAMKESYHERREMINKSGLRLCPGVREFIDWAKGKGYPMALASSNYRRVIEFNMRHSGLEGCFDAEVGREDVDARLKPAPDIYLAACGRLGIAPEECFAMDDSKPGMISAHAAGTYPVMVVGLQQPDDECRRLARAVLPVITDAIPILEKIGM